MWLPVAMGLHAALEAYNSNLNISFFRGFIDQPPDGKNWSARYS
jgi:hypothetical protein